VQFFSILFGMLIFWVFAVKYWGLARKLKLMEQSKNMDEDNRTLNIILFVGVGLMVCTASIEIVIVD
jgi:hypothetical protein